MQTQVHEPSELFLSALITDSWKQKHSTQHPLLPLPFQLPQDENFGKESSDPQPSCATCPSPQQSRLVKSLSSDCPGRGSYSEVSDVSKNQRDRQADSMFTRMKAVARAHMVPGNSDGEGDEFGPNPGTSFNGIPPFQGNKTYPLEFVGQGRLTPSLGWAEEGVAKPDDPRGRLSEAARALVQWPPVGNGKMKSNHVRSSSVQFSVRHTSFPW